MHNNLGNIFKDRGKLDEAVASYRQRCNCSLATRRRTAIICIRFSIVPA